MNSSGQKPVLVLEDEPIVAMLVEDMLMELGYERIEAVGDSASALEIAGREELAFAILDVNIAGAPTFAVADALIGRGVPFIFATGYGPAAVEEAYAGVPTLQKPFLLAQLDSAIARLIRSP